MKVTLVTQAYCESCTKAKGLLDSYNVNFSLCSLDHQGSTELRRLFDSQGIRTAPAVFVDRQYIGGYEDLKQFLEDNEPYMDDQYSFGEKLDGE